jgi:hypothetical protein
MASDSSSSSFSSSYPSDPGLTDWEQQLSQIIAGVGAQTYNWAQQVYGKTSAMTDQLIGQFQQQANSNMGNANALMTQYNAIAPGELNNLAQDAATYASTPRIQQNMGAAESQTGQAMDQGRINAEQHLQSFGIDPSSGRYAELEQAQQASKAAAQAGAGQEAELATEATGRELRGQSIAAEQQVPGQAVNFVNSAIGATQGANQANLGNAAVGAQLMDAAAPYYGDAMNLKLPPNTTTSHSSQQSSSGGGSGGGSGGSSDSSGDGSGGGGSGGGSGGGGGGYYGDGISPEGNGEADPSFGTGNSNDSQYGAPSVIDDSGAGAGATFDSGGDSGYATGGGVLPQPTTGGHVPYHASPSAGANTDDVNARLNAGEFVVPRDVAAWKGQEFFQKLIEESRRRRTGAPAKGKPKPALSGPPQFQSRPLPQPSMGAQ